MKFTLSLIAAFAGVALAMPANLEERQYQPCAGLAGSAQCCAVDVLGVADLDCVTPPQTPTSGSQFSAVCAAIGQKARCCAIPLLGQGVVCDTPNGVTD